jgi:hypothetical protein
VIYATERGYNYAGDEYWQSFDEQTPEWEFADRYKIVPWFRKFQKTYDGVLPSGPWAAHFRINRMAYYTCDFAPLPPKTVR